jgi:uncharacterized membrane protein YraQ (UPF0718 family)
MVAMQKNHKRNFTAYALGLVALILAFIAWQVGGYNLVLSGLKSGGENLETVVLSLVAAFITAGMIQSLVSEEMIARWLGAESGWRGMILACLGGSLIPGGPYVYYPIAGVFLKNGAGIGVLVAFVTAKNLWSVSRIPIEIALLGSDLTFIRYGITFIIPPILGFLAESFFGQFTDRIREAVRQ